MIQSVHNSTFSPKRNESYIPRNTCTQMFTTALFVIAKIRDNFLTVRSYMSTRLTMVPSCLVNTSPDTAVKIIFQRWCIYISRLWIKQIILPIVRSLTHSAEGPKEKVWGPPKWKRILLSLDQDCNTSSFFFLPHHVVCGILVPRLRIKPMSPALSMDS